MTKNILIAEDDEDIVGLLRLYLEKDGYKVISVDNGEDAFKIVKNSQISLALLDIMMPKMNGYELTKKIREITNIPIIILSAKTLDSEKILGLDLGADDYLTKPFSVEELLARIRVTERRIVFNRREQNESNIFVNGKLKIDYSSGCAYIDEKELHLTPIEYKLLCLLASNVGKVLTHTYLTQKIWGHSWENDVASLRVFMATLRRKIEKDTNHPHFIVTEVGVGYYFKD